ncbi:MAG: hypothetical protein R2719_02390 [Micropruina sp.]
MIRPVLAGISAATIDRMLTGERRRMTLRRSRTKPGSLLKDQIPIRTFADWKTPSPGSSRPVAHDGGVAAGEYCYTLTRRHRYRDGEPVPNKARCG